MWKPPFEEIVAWAAVIHPGKKVYAIVPYAFAEKFLPQGWELADWGNSRSIIEINSSSKMPYALEGKGFRKVSFEELDPERAEVPEETIEVETTKSGLSALWERGGATGAGGSSVVITDKNGAPKKPLFIRTRGDLANEDHALLVLNRGDHILDVQTSYGEPYIVKVLQVIGFQDEPIEDEDDLLSLLGQNPAKKSRQRYARCRVVAVRRGDAWWPELPAHLQDAYEAAVKKANAYHCRTATYVIH